MVTTEVQRTLVKSPPELWAELSDQDSLARHLSEFGEIRITSTVAESAVHWESDEASGSALIKQAGWGTKVTLRATVRATEPEPEHDPPALRRPTRPRRHRRPPPRPRRRPRLPARRPPPPQPGRTEPVHRGSPGPLTAAAMRDAVEPSRPQREPPRPARRARPRRPRPPAREPPSRSRRRPRTRACPAPRGPGARGRRESDRPTPRGRADPEPTRRGFFARLFGRRARRPEERDQAPERARGGRRAARPSRHRPPSPSEPTALEALQARFAARPQAPEPPPGRPTPSVDGPLRLRARSRPTRAARRRPLTRPDRRPLARIGRRSDRRPGAPPDHTDSAEDLSSELRRAEEIAAAGREGGPHRGPGQGDPHGRARPARGGPPQALLTAR